MESNDTKLCKHCQMEIPKKAKVCPHCKKKQGGKLKWIIIAIIVIAIISAAIGGSGDDKKQAKTDSSGQDTVTENKIEYTAVDVATMVNELDTNAMKASETYKDQYLEITGKLNVIDSSGEYISLVSADDDFAIIGVQCYIKNDEQREAIMNMSIGDTVTLRGKCTDVGEVLGYSLDIDSIN